MTFAEQPVTLRDVIADDLPIFFEHQRDPVANALADFPARAREAFMAHWEKIMGAAAGIQQTVVYDGRVAGNIVCWEQGGQRLIGYWLGREFWGQGIATRALRLFVARVSERPLLAHVVKHNHPSRRVLEKCGFVLCGEDGEELVLKLG